MPRQLALVVATMALNTLACFIEAQALGGDLLATLIWAVLFTMTLAGGEVVLSFLYRHRHHARFRRRIVGLMMGAFLASFGVLRFFYLASAMKSGLSEAFLGAVLFTACICGFFFVGYLALVHAEPLQVWRSRRLARASSGDAEQTSTPREG